MERWTPLAPTQRSAGMYTRADIPSPERRRSLLKGRTSASHTAEERTPLPPSDPFPPVGIFPRFVALHILSFLPLADLKNCALAGRSLAAAVADDRTWSRRLHVLDWCKVDGLRIEDRDISAADDDRDIGRRRKGKAKAKEGETSASVESATKSPLKGKDASVSAADEDDFGDFAGPSMDKDDSFGDYVFTQPSAGAGSLASGTASVALGRGQPVQDQSAFSSNSFHPSRGIHTQRAAPAGSSSLFSFNAETRLPLSSSSASFRKLRVYAKALRPYLKSLRDTSGPPASSLLFTCDLGQSSQTALLSNLLRFISTSVGGCRGPSNSSKVNFTEDEESSLSYRSQEAAQHLANNLLSSFEGTIDRRGDAIRAATHGADTTRAIRRAEDDMRMHANGIWELGNARLALALSERDEFAGDQEDVFGRMSAARAFLDRREVFSLGLRGHDPLENVASRPTLDFTPMDSFMHDVLETVKADGEIIARVFPPEQDILLAYADRVAHEVVAKYVLTLLDHTKTLSKHLYLRSCAATFAQTLKIVDLLLSIEPRDEEIVSRTRCEDVVYQTWESNMDDYLNAERSWVVEEMQKVTEKWESDRESEAAASRVDAAFLNSQNPAAVKRSVLSGFKDVLLLPVTVVPRTAGMVGGAVIRTAGTGLSSLNPRRWQGGAATSSAKRGVSPSNVRPTKGSSTVAASPRTPNEMSEKGYMDFSNGAVTNGVDSESDEDDIDDAPYGSADFNEKDEWSQEAEVWGAVAQARPSKDNSRSTAARKRESTMPSTPTMTSSSLAPTSAMTPSRSSTPVSSTFHGKTTLTQMQLLLSLETALQVIHVNRDCLKRIETFIKYPAPRGERVRMQIQEVSLLCLRALGDGHVSPGLEKATVQIRDWRPEEHTTEGATTEEQQVEPLVHFFELVHVGDTIAQMVQVYFDQELSKHIDRNDFLNPVVKGKKKFESNLDEAVAKGLNAGVDLLLGQAEHIITTRQDIKDFFPDRGALVDLSPTLACKEAIECLRIHCRMLLGTTDKNVLEVFYQEVGIRLYAIICKHLKKQIISIDGGFKVIADLNEYHSFVASLKQASVTADFEHLKMLGNIFIIDNPKELAKIARDANMFGGTLSPEELYEFLHARSDFRLIEKAVDKEMYGFKVAEDCIVV